MSTWVGRPTKSSEPIRTWTLSQIHAALAYYYDHPEEINEEMRESEELVESLKGEYAKRPTAEAV